MAKVMLICGKICSGKTYYARSLAKDNLAVLLSVDEILLALFGTDVGEALDANVAKIEKYLFHKTLELIGDGISAVLDWGFFSREKRRLASEFFAEHAVPFEWYYIDASAEVLQANLEKRNLEIEEKGILFFHFDVEDARRAWAVFQVPERAEVDVWVGSDTLQRNKEV